MTTAYTSLLGLALPVTGELSGTWGDTANTAITSLLDTAVAGTTSITTDADIVLSTTTGASNEARQAIILWNPASGTVTRNITAPAQSKMYTVINASGGTQSIVIRGAGPTTGVTVLKGESALVAWNGSDFVKVSSIGGSLTLLNLTVTGNTILGDAAADTLTVNATSTFNAPVSFAGQVKLPSTGRSAAAALTPTNPAFLYGVASTYTDTASSGTLAPVASFYGLAQPTLSTSNVTTYTSAATLYIANAPTTGGSATITNPYAVYVAAGAAYFGGAVTFAGSASLAALTVTSLTNTGLTSGRVVYSTTGGLETDSANLTFDGTNLGLAGGTANGVAYLNGSKVLTTGSALTFSGGILQVGSVSGSKIQFPRFSDNSAFLTVQSSSTVNEIELRNGSGGGENYVKAGNGYLAFGAESSEGMRLTSTGLGIGTSSPVAKLDVSSSVGSTPGNGNATLKVISTATAAVGTGSSIVFSGQTNNSTASYSFAGIQGVKGSAAAGDYSGSLLFLTQNSGGSSSLAEAMRIDSSGNVGIGTSSPGNKFAVLSADNTEATGIASFTANNGSQAVQIGYNWVGGAGASQPLRFLLNATERMRIDSSGNLNIGRTSGYRGGKLTVSSTNVTQTSTTANVQITTSDTQAINVGGSLGLGGQVGGDETPFGYISGRKENGTSGNYAGYLAFATQNSSAVVAEAMRIDSSGNLLVGRTSTIGGARISAETVTGTPTYATYLPTTGTETAFLFVNPNGTVGSITTNGSATLYNVTSDQRLKENIIDADSASSLIDSLQVRKFDWKANGSHQRYGFIAQELVTVAPEAVHQPADPEEMMAVDYSKLVPMLVKEIQSLRKRLTALEST